MQFVRISKIYFYEMVTVAFKLYIVFTLKYKKCNIKWQIINKYFIVDSINNMKCNIFIYMY